MADSAENLAIDTFRTQARDWLEDNFPASLRGKAGMAMEVMEGGAPAGDLLLWRQRMGEKGWGTPTWPSRYGGGGLTQQEARVLGQEMNRIGAFNPLLQGMGVTMI